MLPVYIPKGPSTNVMRSLSFGIGDSEYGLGQVPIIQVLGPSGHTHRKTYRKTDRLIDSEQAGTLDHQRYVCFWHTCTWNLYTEADVKVLLGPV